MMETSLLTDRRLSCWLSGAVLELNTLKTVEMIVIDFRRNPPAPPLLTIMDGTVTAVELFRFLVTTISQDLKGDNHVDEKRPSRGCISSTSYKEVQPAAGAAETVLLCHHRVCPVFIYNCLVWFSYQNRHQKTTMDSRDC